MSFHHTPINKVAIGSTNQVKIRALQETLAHYPLFSSVQVISADVPSGVSAQPLSLQETIQGAKNRATAARGDNELGFGIESGLFTVPHTKTGFMDCVACVIFDGTTYHVGLSSAFECPPKITELMVTGGLDMSQAFNQTGLSSNPNLGKAQGAVGILTNGRVDRVAYTKQAIIMALIHLENREMFQNA